MRAAYPFADNPYLQETVENLQPAMSRAYFLALDQRKAEMSEYLELFDRLLAAVLVLLLLAGCGHGTKATRVRWGQEMAQPVEGRRRFEGVLAAAGARRRCRSRAPMSRWWMWSPRPIR